MNQWISAKLHVAPPLIFPNFPTFIRQRIGQNFCKFCSILQISYKYMYEIQIYTSNCLVWPMSITFCWPHLSTADNVLSAHTHTSVLVSTRTYTACSLCVSDWWYRCSMHGVWIFIHSPSLSPYSHTLLRVVWMHCMCLISADHERLWDGLLKGYGVLRAGRDPPQGPLKDGGHGSLGTLGTNLREGGGARLKNYM